jgi:hypothetical protein
MAVNETRSMNADLREGITDGVVKKVAPNRGGTPNDFASARCACGVLHGPLYDCGFSTDTATKMADRITTVHG